MNTIKKLIGAAAIAMMATSANALTLSKVDTSYVISMTAAPMIAESCGVTLDKDRFVKLADRLGVDSSINSAMEAALKANLHMPYDRNDLIPEVTSNMIGVIMEIQSGLEKNKTKTCEIWIGGLKKMGVME